MQNFIRFVHWCVVFALVLMGLWLVSSQIYLAECVEPATDGRGLETEASFAAEDELRRFGRIDDLETILHARARLGGLPDRWLKEYRVVTRHSNTGYEISVEPRHWGWCRPIYRVAIGMQK